MLNYFSVPNVQSRMSLLRPFLLLIEHDQQHAARKFFGYVPPMLYYCKICANIEMSYQTRLKLFGTREMCKDNQ
jgi:hypothetical protein